VTRGQAIVGQQPSVVAGPAGGQRGDKQPDQQEAQLVAETIVSSSLGITKLNSF